MRRVDGPVKSLSRMSRARRTVMGLSGIVLIGAVLVAGMLIGQRAVAPAEELSGDAGAGSGPETPTPTPTDGPTASPVPENFVEFRDEEAGFKIMHPKDWELRSPEDPQVRFLATPNDRDSVMVRVSPIELDEVEEEVTEEDVRALHGFTEEIVRGDENVEVLLGPEVVQIADTVGTYYLYTFASNAGDGDERGVHAHYFIFEEDRMVTLILQTIPPEKFSELANVFDVVAESFEFLE